MTLFESLVAIAILAISLAVMFPDLAALRQQREGSLVLRRLANAIYLARSEAARTGRFATLCPSSDGSRCGGAWHDGVLVFLDVNENQVLDSDDELNYRLQFDDPDGTLHWRAFRSKPYLQMTPLGFTRYQNGSFTWCDLRKTPASAHQLIVNRTGRVRFAKDSDGDGLRENSRGLPIVCPP
jgi:type IV fimbrial biogenesis protein FimT